MITVKSFPLKNYTRQFDKAVVVFGSPTCSACKKVTEIVVPGSYVSAVAPAISDQGPVGELEDCH